MKAVFRDQAIELDGFRCFTARASTIVYGAWGDKRQPAADPHHLALGDVLPAPRLAQVKLAVTPLEVAAASKRSLPYLAAVLVVGLGGGRVGITPRDFETGKLRLLKVSPRGDEDLRDAINASPKVIERLVGFGGSARVVVDVLMAVEAERCKRFGQIVGAADVTVVDGLLGRQNRTVSTDPDGTLSVAPGTVIGYSLAEPTWNAHSDRNKTAVQTLRLDAQGS